MSNPDITTVSYEEALLDRHTQECLVVQAVFDKVYWGEADEETTNEEFAVEGDWVTYLDLIEQFGEQAIAAFMQRAEERAR